MQHLRHAAQLIAQRPCVAAVARRYNDRLHHVGKLGQRIAQSPGIDHHAQVSVNGVKVGGLPFIGPQLDAMLPEWFTGGMGINFYFGGTSLLIVVGVAMDTVQQVESQLVMRNYEGFMKRGRIRGRRG